MATLDEGTKEDSPKPVKTARKSHSVPTEPTSLVTKVKDKKSRGSGEKSSSLSHKAPSTPKTLAKKKKVSASRPDESPEHKKSSVSTEKAPQSPKTLSKTNKLLNCSSRSTNGQKTKTPNKAPKAYNWEFKMVSPSPDKDAGAPPTKQIPLAPALAATNNPSAQLTHRRRASTSAAAPVRQRDKDDSLTKSSHTSSSTSSGASFGEDKQGVAPSPKSLGGSKADKELLKALTLISKADQSKVLEALNQLGEGSLSMEVLQGELLGKEEGSTKKTKHEKDKKGKKALTKAKAKG